MTQPTPLEPTLYALLPPSSRPSLLAHLSLLAILAEPLRIEDRVYATINGVVPGQLRNLRLRSRWVKVGAGGGKGKDRGKGKAEEGEEGQWVRTLSYVSAPLRSAEYSEASVRAVLGVEIQGMSSLQEIDTFIETLGFQQSHTYTITGTLLHLPVHYPANPPLTLHLSIAHLTPSSPSIPSTSPTSPSPPPSPSSSQPYVVQLHPSRPVYAVPHPGDIGLQDVIALMRSVAGQVDGLEWSTGSGV